MIVLKIAFRNLRQHRAKTAIIGALVAFAAFFLVAGNSLLDSVSEGMRASYAEGFTGDLILHGVGNRDFSLIEIGPGREDLPIIPEFQRLRSAAEGAEGVEATLPLLSGSAVLSLDEEAAGFTQLWGVDFAEYRRMFPESVVLLEGGFPAAGEAAILLSELVRDEAGKEAGRPIRVGDALVLGGMGGGGTRLREVKVAGVFRFRRGGDQLDLLSLVDAGTLRSLQGMGLSRPAPSKVVAAEPGLALSDDDLFSSADLVTEAGAAAGPLVDLDDILGDLSAREGPHASAGDAWHFLLIRLADPGAAGRVGKLLTGTAAAAGLDAAVSDWRWGAGMVADLAYSLQLAFNAVVAVVSLVAAVIIMNTLVISVTERIPEIGTIRAIGGRKSFVRSMIIWETLSVSGLFGLLGSLLGIGMVLLLRLVGLSSDNLFFKLLVGGEIFRPQLSVSALVGSLCVTALIGVVSSLYPVSVALKTSPVRAMQKA